MILKSPCKYITIAQPSIYAFGIRQSLHRNMSRQGTDFHIPSGSPNNQARLVFLLILSQEQSHLW